MKKLLLILFVCTLSINTNAQCINFDTKGVFISESIVDGNSVIDTLHLEITNQEVLIKLNNGVLEKTAIYNIQFYFINLGTKITIMYEFEWLDLIFIRGESDQVGILGPEKEAIFDQYGDRLYEIKFFQKI